MTALQGNSLFLKLNIPTQVIANPQLTIDERPE